MNSTTSYYTPYLLRFFMAIVRWSVLIKFWITDLNSTHNLYIRLADRLNCNSQRRGYDLKADTSISFFFFFFNVPWKLQKLFKKNIICPITMALQSKMLNFMLGANMGIYKQLKQPTVKYIIYFKVTWNGLYHGKNQRKHLAKLRCGISTV